MAQLANLVDDGRRIGRFLSSKLYSFVYGDLDSFIQRRRLGRYGTDVQQHISWSSFGGAATCIFVFHQPSGDVPADIARLFSTLDAQNINIVVVLNHPISKQQRDFFATHAAVALLRSNQGYDFGGYKDAIAFLRNEAVHIERLVLLNDSVFFASRGLPEFVSGLLGKADVIAAHENWSEGHHLQSFALSLSGEVFRNPAFAAFWQDYVPINNRLHAIERGEKALSATLLSLVETSEVLYSVAKLRSALDTEDGLPIDDETLFPIRWRPELEELRRADETKHDAAARLVALIDETSTIHSGAYLFPRYLASPLFKKDLVYRNRFYFWEIERWIGELMPRPEADLFLNILRKKQDASVLSRREERRHRVGAL